MNNAHSISRLELRLRTAALTILDRAKINNVPARLLVGDSDKNNLAKEFRVVGVDKGRPVESPELNEIIKAVTSERPLWYHAVNDTVRLGPYPSKIKEDKLNLSETITAEMPETKSGKSSKKRS